MRVAEAATGRIITLHVEDAFVVERVFDSRFAREELLDTVRTRAANPRAALAVRSDELLAKGLVPVVPSLRIDELFANVSPWKDWLAAREDFSRLGELWSGWIPDESQRSELVARVTRVEVGALSLTVGFYATELSIDEAEARFSLPVNPSGRGDVPAVLDPFVTTHANATWDFGGDEVGRLGVDYVDDAYGLPAVYRLLDELQDERGEPLVVGDWRGEPLLAWDDELARFDGEDLVRRVSIAGLLLR